MTRTELQKQANGKTYDGLTELKISGILMTLSLHIQNIFLHKQRGKSLPLEKVYDTVVLPPEGKTTIYMQFSIEVGCYGGKAAIQYRSTFFLTIFKLYIPQEKRRVFKDNF